MPKCKKIVIDTYCWSKSDQPQGYDGKGTKGKGQGQDFHTLVKTLTLGGG
jgi:hypothetical protein